MKTYRPRAIVETGFMIALAVIFALLTYIVPGLGILINFLMPVPFAIIGVRHGIRWNLLGFIASFFIISFFAGPITALMEIGTFGTMGLVLGLAYRYNWSVIFRLLGPAIVFSLSFVVQIYFTLIFMHIDLLKLLQTSFIEGMNNSLAMYRQMGVAEAQLTQMRQYMELMWTQMQIIIPGALGVSSLIISYIDGVVANTIFRRLGMKDYPFPPVIRWEMPKVTLYAFVLSWICVYWGQQWAKPWMEHIGQNLNIIVMMLLWVQGIAFLKFFVTTQRWPSATFTIILIGSLFIPLMTMILVGAGIMDMIMGVRKKRNYGDYMSPNDSE